VQPHALHESQKPPGNFLVAFFMSRGTFFDVLSNPEKYFCNSAQIAVGDAVQRADNLILSTR
jgi:hypothetical protein